jgi:hypothetical protein
VEVIVIVIIIIFSTTSLLSLALASLTRDTLSVVQSSYSPFFYTNIPQAQPNINHPP